MATHYCVSMPCWICHPEFAPKVNDAYSEQFTVPEGQLSGILKKLLQDIFVQGLKNGAHLFENEHFLNIEDLKSERVNISSDSFEAKLLDLMIKDIEAYDESF